LITIREAVKEDLSLIHGIEVDVYPSPWSFSFFKMMFLLKSSIFLVAKDDGKLVGYCVGEVVKIGKQDAPLYIGHVLNLAVSRSHQNRGIGPKILVEIEGRFRENEVETVFLEVRESNEVAKGMYRRRGYRFVRTLKGYYRDEDGLVMMKSLTR
jgi:ribosomal-protein-alanine N-acetyltransferase